MPPAILALLLLAASADSTTSATPRPDSSAAPRVVRQLPTVEVRALLKDQRLGQTVHEVGTRALRSYPVDRLVDVVSLQPGVVASGEELHVRGGRAGETVMVLGGMSLNEPLRQRPTELPLLAVRGVDVVSGMPESRYPGALAGVLDIHTMDPTDRFGAEWRWQSDGGLDTRFDRWSARVSSPLPVGGLGFVAAGDVLLDNTSLPQLRTLDRRPWNGLSIGWRAENRVMSWAKLAPVCEPQRFELQMLTSRQVRRPYDPAWSLDGWSGADSNGIVSFSTDPQPGYLRYRAADHLATTDERRVVALVSLTAQRAAGRMSVGLGWLQTRTATAVGGTSGIGAPVELPTFGTNASGDPFHVLSGNDPLQRESRSDAYQFRADLEKSFGAGSVVRTGAGLSYEEVRLEELDATLLPFPLDAVRSYHAYAPGGFAYLQGRWEREGVVVSPGLRADYFTPGPAGDDQTLPADGAWISLSPRFVLAYPLTSRDIFSFAWARAHQAPARDLLYDRRVSISNRQPLGNPALRPAVQISYEAAVKHLFGPSWALQSSLFYRDVARQAGTRSYQVPGGPLDLRYTDDDQASAAGFEWSLQHDAGEKGRAELSYTFMQAWGYESRPEGDPYGALRDVRSAPIGERPLSWDRRHTILFAGFTRWRNRVELAWSTAVGSPLPWTPKPRRTPPTDLSATNSRRLGWTETTNLDLRWSPPYTLGLTFGLEVRNLFDHRGERLVTVDGYPNPEINTLFDDYGAYRTETGLGGGAYWTGSGWTPVHDPRLFQPPRAVRMSVGRSW